MPEIINSHFTRVGIMSFMVLLLVFYQLQHGIIRTIHLSFTMFYMIIYICIIHERQSLQPIYDTVMHRKTMPKKCKVSKRMIAKLDLKY